MDMLNVFTTRRSSPITPGSQIQAPIQAHTSDRRDPQPIGGSRIRPVGILVEGGAVAEDPHVRLTRIRHPFVLAFACTGIAVVDAVCGGSAVPSWLRSVASWQPTFNPALVVAGLGTLLVAPSGTVPPGAVAGCHRPSRAGGLNGLCVLLAAQ